MNSRQHQWLKQLEKRLEYLREKARVGKQSNSTFYFSEARSIEFAIDCIKECERIGLLDQPKMNHPKPR